MWLIPPFQSHLFDKIFITNLAHQGNLTENSTFLSFSLMLNGAILAICAYMGFFQSYVLLIELIFCCIQAGLIILETIFGVVALATFSRYRTFLKYKKKP